jgi:hypothetical protein
MEHSLHLILIAILHSRPLRQQGGEVGGMIMRMVIFLGVLLQAGNFGRKERRRQGTRIETPPLTSVHMAKIL